MIHFSTVSKVIKMLPKRQRIKFISVLFFGVIAALIEVVGVGSVAPFLAVASYPETIHKNYLLSKAYNLFSFSSDKNFVIFLGLAVLVFIVTTNSFKAFNRMVTIRFTSRCRHILATQLMDGYLRQKYVFFLHRGTHEFVKNINGEIQNIFATVFQPFIEFTASLVQICFFSIFLIYMNPFVSLLVFLGVSLVYMLMYAFLRNKLKSLGLERYNLNQDRSRILSEAFWGIKEMKLAGKEHFFSSEYAEPSLKMTSVESKAEVLSDVPKYALETIASAVILLYVMFVVVTVGDLLSVSVTAGVFVYAGYRLIPATQTMFRSITKMKFGSAAVDKIMQEFDTVKDAEALSIEPVKERLSFENNISINNIYYKYPTIDKYVINDVSVKINKNETVGFMGTTGSGKTTLINIICGLLDPEKGDILIDGQKLNHENVRSWQANIGYVPQTIYLSNSSIAHNIAFGVPIEEIDMQRVIESAKMAQIHDFIDSHYPRGYESSVGERGVCLSGGQRQRIGIARALYHEPAVLIFDEATSALDNKTEAELMAAIENISGKLTIVMIAHRLSTLKNCNNIYHLEGGRITEEGRYNDLVEKKMV